MDKDRKINSPIFIIGAPRSGTTVIAEAISSHDDLSWFSNYLNMFPKYPEISLLNRVIDFPHIGWFFRGKKPQKNRKKVNIRSMLPYSVEAYRIWEYYISEKFLFDYLENVKAKENEAKAIHGLIYNVLKIHKKKRFITKYTGPPKIIYIDSIFPDAIFLNVVRDPRSVVSSLMKVKFWKNNGGYYTPWWKNGLKQEYIAEWKEYNRSPIALAAIQWKQIIEVTLNESKRIDQKRYLEIKYEDFIKNLDYELNEILKILKLNKSINIEKYINNIGKITDEGKKYKKYLKSHEIEIINKITENTAGKIGYYLD